MEGRNRPETKISPSILSADFADLGNDSARMLEYGATWLHVDCMDGHFVPNLTLGPPILESLRKRTKAFLDCHMMVSDPDFWVERYAKAGADGYCFHVEAVDPSFPLSDEGAEKVKVLCKKIKENNMRVGIAIKPGSPAEVVLPFVDESLVDMILVMTVEPGFGGQKFMPDMMSKVKFLREKYPSLDIQVDGGVGPKTVDTVAEAGANVLVAGSAIFLADDPKAVIKELSASVDSFAVKA